MCLDRTVERVAGIDTCIAAFDVVLNDRELVRDSNNQAVGLSTGVSLWRDRHLEHLLRELLGEVKEDGRGRLRKVLFAKDIVGVEDGHVEKGESKEERWGGKNFEQSPGF